MQFNVYQRLGQALGYHLVSWNIGELNPFSSNFITNIIMLDIDIFCLSMKD